MLVGKLELVFQDSELKWFRALTDKNEQTNLSEH